MVKRIVAVLGSTGTGKSEVCNLLKTLGYFEVHPIKLFKDFVCQVYGLTEGDLEKHSVKFTKPKGANSTYQEMLVDSFEFWNRHDPQFSARQLKVCIDGLPRDAKVVIPSIRNRSEVRLILDYRNRGVDLKVIRLHRNTGKTEITDQSVNLLFNELSEGAEVLDFYNNGTIEDLHVAVLRFLNDKHYRQLKGLFIYAN